MKHYPCKSIISVLLISILLFGSVKCAAVGKTADEVNTLVGGIVSCEASSKGVNGRQGIVDYFASNEMTLGGEWYVISFIQNNYGCDYSRYEKALISYLRNNSVYSATSREKFALTLIALNSGDKRAKKYIEEVSEEAIGAQGIMSLIFGLHLLNNGCKSSAYTPYSLALEIVSLQNEDGGWSVSGANSDVDVTAMALQSLYPFRNSLNSEIEKAVKLLSSRQRSDGTYQSYGVYNAESTAQVIIALSSLGIDASADERFVKDGSSAFDGLLKFRKSDGSFCHTENGSKNASATSQALNAFVAYSRFINHSGAFYKMPHSFSPYAEATAEPSADNSVGSGQNADYPESERITASVPSHTNNHGSDKSEAALSEKANGEAVLSDGSSVPSEDGSYSVQTYNNGSIESIGQNGSTPEITEGISNKDELITYEIGEAVSSISLTKSFKIKLCIISAVLLAAIILCAVLIVLKKRNKKNYIVIGFAALIIIVSVLFMRISAADDYYNSSVYKTDTVGTVTVEVRCDTVDGLENAPENPVILEETEVEINENDTVYNVLAQALQKAGIPFEHNASYYISGIDNLYEFQFGDLSGWMYLVNGETPSVGCGEYKVSDGDRIQWLYTCDIGNDLKRLTD